MSENKSTEEQTEKIDAIVGNEVLGYEGPAQGEHSGQHETGDDAASGDGLEDTLADNRRDDVR
jgi:hypothetical protein